MHRRSALRRPVPALTGPLAVLVGALALAAGLLGPAPSPASAAVDPGSGHSYETTPVVVPMTFPVVGRSSWSDTFLACRSGCARMHMGQDVMAAKMTPLVAAFDGVITSLSRGGSAGNTLVLTADRGRAAGWSALYLHVNNDTPGTDDGRGSDRWAYPAGLEVGSRVLEGQLVGWVGDSGNAEETGPHLHLELRRGEGWRGVVHNAAPSLRSARRLARPLPAGPHPTGSLVRHPTGALFLLEGPNDAPVKRPVSDAVLASLGRTPDSAVPMTSAESLGYPTRQPVVPRDGTVVRDPRGTTWLVTGGSRAKAPLPRLAALGLAAPRLHRVSHADLAPLPVAPELPATPFYPGALHRLAGRVHVVGADGVLHPATSSVTASHGWVTRDVLVPGEVDPGQVPAVGDPLPLRDGTLVVTGGPRVGVVSDGAFRRIHDTRQVDAYGYTGRPRQVVPFAEVVGLREAALTAR